MKQAYFNERQNSTSLLTLPIEIIVRILEILHAEGKLKPRLLRVSKLFYQIVLPMIYSFPQLRAHNILRFVETMSSRKDLGKYIRVLDLSLIIQSGKNAFIAKLLKRSKNNLEVFVAPQTSFGLGPLIALKNCRSLKVLDLRLVSETLNLSELFNSISPLQELTHLSFPRSSLEIFDHKAISWPPKLSFLRISGGITNEFLMESNFPSTITSLEFAHCPAIDNLGFQSMICRLGNNLKCLKVQYPMPSLASDSLDFVFTYCPHLIVLEVTVDYLTSSFFDEESLPFVPYKRPLKTLYINSSGMLGTSNKLDPIDLAVAINEDRLPSLKNLQCTAKIGWDPESDYVSFIASHLSEKGGGLYIGY